MRYRLSVKSTAFLLILLLCVSLIPGIAIADDTALTVTGDGVAVEKMYTEAELKEMPREIYTYSTINRYPTKNTAKVDGIKLSDLLAASGLKSGATTVTIHASDGYKMTFTVKELLDDTRYSYPNLQSGSEDGRFEVPATISVRYASGGGELTDNFTMNFCLGQRTIREQNHPWIVSKVSKIEVSTANVSQCDRPTASHPAGALEAGTKVSLQHALFDGVKIYYTTDGSTPTINSAMYNVSATNFQPELNVPITVDKNMTIKAIAVAPGKGNSDVATFRYTVSGGVQDGVVYVDEGIEATAAGDALTGNISSGRLDAVLADIGDSRVDGAELILRLYLEGVEGSHKSAKFVLSEQIIADLIAADLDKVAFDCGLGVVTMDRESLVDLRSMSGEVIVGLSESVYPVEQGEPPVSLRFDISAGGVNVTNFSSLVKLAFAHAMDESVPVFTYDGQGRRLPIKLSVYNPATGIFEVLIRSWGFYGVDNFSATFNDIENHWAKSHVLFAYARNIVGGYGDGRFGPGDKVTRGQFLKILCESLDNLNLSNAPDPKFTDVAADHLFYKYIAWGAQNGIINGYGDGRFGPGDDITREQMATILDRFIGAVGVTAEARYPENKFNDAGLFHAYARASIAKMQRAGFINGKENNYFDPLGTTTRGEAVKLSSELIKYIVAPAGYPADAATAAADQISLSFHGDGDVALRFRIPDGVTDVPEIQYIKDDMRTTFTQARAETVIAADVSALSQDYRLCKAVITGLEPSTKYAYRIGAGGKWSGFYTFETRPNRDGEVNFLYLADTQALPEAGGYGDLENLIAAAVADFDPDFTVIGGDLINDGGDHSEWADFFGAAGNLFASIPVMPASGNHDENVASVFNLPENGPAGFDGFYSFDYGNAHFIVLNCNDLGNINNVEKIGAWLRGDLEGSDKTWKIVVSHYPFFVAAGIPRDMERAETLRENYLPLLEECGVALILSGHQHVYSRTFPMRAGEVSESGGIVQLMTVSGPKLYVSTEYDYMAKTIDGKIVYSEISIDAETMNIVTKDASGAALDTYTIEK